MRYDLSLPILPSPWVNAFGVTPYRVEKNSSSSTIQHHVIHGFDIHAHTTHTEIVTHILPAIPSERSSVYHWIDDMNTFEKPFNCLYVELEATVLREEVHWRREFLLSGVQFLSLDQQTFYLDFNNFKGDTVLTLESFLALKIPSDDSVEAIVLRTKNNPRYLKPTTQYFDYSDTNPTYASPAFIQYLCRSQFPRLRHILVDVPSLDREKDFGCLMNHRLFFDPTLEFLVVDNQFSNDPPLIEELLSNNCRRTVTEHCHIPSGLPFITGNSYDLYFEFSNYRGFDAVPSRPFLVLQEYK